MYNHRNRACKTSDWRTGRVINKKARNIYTCPTYYIHHNDCSMHYISTASVSALILETIRRTTAFARNNEAGFVKIIQEASAIRHGETADNHKKLISNNEKRIAELDVLFRKTYEDFSAGLLNEKRFSQLSSIYETEQETLEKQTTALKAELAQIDSDNLRADKFLDLVKRYTDFSELTAPMLHEFVEKVIVHEADRSSGKREQKVDIFLNYIGQFDALEGTDPVEEPGEEKRVMWRDYKRKERARKKMGQIS